MIASGVTRAFEGRVIFLAQLDFYALLKGNIIEPSVYLVAEGNWHETLLY
jgi:hypothetical protein